MDPDADTDPGLPVAAFAEVDPGLADTDPGLANTDPGLADTDPGPVFAAAAPDDDGHVDPGVTGVMGVAPHAPIASPPAPPAQRARAAAGRADRRGLGLAVVGAAALLGGVLGGAWAAGIGPFDEGDTPITFSANRYPAEPVEVALATLSATSTHAPIGENRYDIELVDDGDLVTAWNSDGDVRADGIGERIVIELERPAWVRELIVANGYQKDLPTYLRNARLRNVRLELDGAAFDVELLDVEGRQRIPLDEPRLTTRIILEVVDVARGDTYRDLAISEIDVVGWVADPEHAAHAARTRAALTE